MKRILVMDDDPATRLAIRAVLEPSGYEVAEAADGEEGMESQRRQPADLAIVDILMPKKEGIETIRELRRDFPETKIIAVSGSGAQYLSAARDFGVALAFTKPFDRDEMLESVRGLLGDA